MVQPRPESPILTTWCESRSHAEKKIKRETSFFISDCFYFCHLPSILQSQPDCFSR